VPYGVPVTNEDQALGRTARLDVLFVGYADDRVAGTVSPIRDSGRVIVVDPGMVPSRAVILEPLAAPGVAPEDVTDVVRSHHHPDHTPQDLTVLVGTDHGVAAPTHLWWSAAGPAEDPYAPDADLLQAQRERVLGVADRIAPGHGTPFSPGLETPGNRP
jgi:glyoxylase-like metal-dependent hydrolase (beta-lactamase superfamily II)